MGSPIPSNDVPASQEEILPTSAGDKEIESQPSLGASQITLDRFGNTQKSNFKNTESEDVLMGPPGAESSELELPSLKLDGRHSRQSKGFGGEIPDSEAMTDKFSISEEGDRNQAEIGGGEPSKACEVDKTIVHPLGTAIQLIAEVPDSDGSDEEMEEALPCSQFIEPSGTSKIVPQEADVSSPGTSVTRSGETQLFTTADSSIEQENSIIEACAVPETKDIIITGRQRIETEHDRSARNLSSTDSLGTANGPRAVPIPSLDESIIKPTAVYANDQSTSSALSTEMAHGECSPLATDAETPQAFIQRNANAVSQPVPSTLTKLDETVSSSFLAKPEGTSQESAEKKEESFASTELSSSPAKIEDQKSSQAKDIKSPITPFRGSEELQKQDVMMAELKAMKIASLQARNSALEEEIAKRNARLEEVTRDLQNPAAETVKKHIKLLHNYNDIRDVGQGLIGMIADNRGVRVGELYDEFGVGLKD